MVLFENITNNQRVEVRHEGQILRGTVKYKGSLNGVKGEWVGVELDKPYGFHDGMVHARRYFFCRPKHGIFTTANNIRFIPMKRCLYNKYRPVSPSEAIVDEVLFGRGYTTPVENLNIVEEQRRKLERPHTANPYLEAPPQFHRPHSVSNHMAPVSWLRPESARAKLNSSMTDLPLHSTYRTELQHFTNPPSIPKSHMPYNVLQKQVKKGWEKDHYVRHMTVNTGRDSIKLSQWNDIS